MDSGGTRRPCRPRRPRKAIRLWLGAEAAHESAVGVRNDSTMSINSVIITWKQRVKTKTLSLYAFCTLCFLLPCQCVQAVGGYEADGYVIHKITLESGVVARSSITLFTLWVAGSTWRLALLQTNDLDGIEAGYDGTNLIRLIHFEHAIEEQKKSSKPVGINVASADIMNTPVPQFLDAPAISFLWFAYASKEYLKSAPKDQLRPIELFSIDPGFFEVCRSGYEQRALLLRSTSPPFLPETAIYYWDGVLLRSRSLIKRTPPFEKDFTNSVFRALMFTNVNNLHIPIHCTLITFALKASATNCSDTYVKCRAEIVVTNVVTNIHLSRFTPECPGNTRVLDRRYMNDNPSIPVIGYMVNSNWLPTDQVRASSGYAKARATHAALNLVIIASQRPRIISRATVLLLVVINIAFAISTVPLIRSYKNKRKLKNL